MAGSDARGHQPVSRIADQRHAGVADQQHRRPGLDVADQRRNPRRLVLVEQADHLARGRHVERLGQGADPAGVLGGDHIGGAKGADQPRGCIRWLAQRRGADEQPAGGHGGQPTIAGVTAPADELVAKERAVPVISPAPLVPVADFGPVDRLQGWAMTAVLTALAAVTRFLNLGSPTDFGTPIFDEKHYAPQGWQLLHNHGVEDNPGYGLVVHPPVGKQLIALGEALFGYDGLGWRFSGAVCGVILVLLVVRIGRRISRSTVVGGIAGLLLICDGVTFVTARTALLDGFLTLFVVAAFGCLIVDRDQVRERMHVALLEGRIGDTPFGPRLGVRWWRFGAGVLLGLACATKWSGLYFIVFFGVMTLSFDIAARRQYRVPRPWVGALRRDSRAGVVRAGADPVRRVHGVVRAVVRVGDRREPA